MSGRVRTSTLHLVGREGCMLQLRENLFLLKMTAHFSLFLFPSVSTSTPPPLTLKRVSLYKDVGMACHKDTGQAAQWAPLHHL